MRTPVIVQCPVALECQVRHQLTLGSHDLCVGEVPAVGVDGSLLNSQGQVDYGLAQLLACIGGSYYRLGERLGVLASGAVGRIGILARTQAPS